MNVILPTADVTNDERTGGEGCTGQGCGANPESGAPTLARRTLLQRGAGIVGVLGLAAGGCGMGGASEPSGPIAAGNVSATPVGYLALVPGQNVVLGRDSGGLYAMSAVCTHAGCVVAAKATQLDCGCHGSRFSATGAVVRGPAGRPLQHFLVELAADGAITIQADHDVAPETRTAVA